MTVLFTYKGHEVSLSDEHQFIISGVEFEERSGIRSFESAAKAREAIDRRMALAARAITEQLALPALDVNGREIVIRGINRATGLLLCTPQIDDLGGYSSGLYPPGTAVRDALKRRQNLRNELKKIDDLLHKLRIPGRSVQGRVDVDHYERAIVTLKHVYEQACEAALKIEEADLIEKSTALKRTAIPNAEEVK